MAERFLFFASIGFFFFGVSTLEASPGFTLRGKITTDKSASSVRVLLQDRAAKSSEVSGVDADSNGNYNFRGLQNRAYRLIAVIDGKKQERRDIDIVCRMDSVVSQDFHYGKLPAKLMLGFPSEDPEVVDVSETPLDVPNSIFLEFEKALVELKSARPAKLIEKLDSIAARVPNFYGVHTRLGLLYQQEGCFSDSAAEYTRASQISPRSVQPLLNLASVQIQAAGAPESHDAMLSAALDTLKKALEIKPTSALAYCLYGAAHVMDDSLEEAEHDFRHALELDDELSAAILMLANLDIHRKNYNAAIENLDKYLENFAPASDRRIVKNLLDEARFKAQAAEK